MNTRLVKNSLGCFVSAVDYSRLQTNNQNQDSERQEKTSLKLYLFNSSFDWEREKNWLKSETQSTTGWQFVYRIKHRMYAKKVSAKNQYTHTHTHTQAIAHNDEVYTTTKPYWNVSVAMCGIRDFRDLK